MSNLAPLINQSQLSRSLLLASILYISGCSVMDLIPSIQPKPGIEVDTELTVGDKQVETQADVAVRSRIVGKREEKKVTTTTTNTADTITQTTYTTVNKTRTDYMGYFLALLVGLMLPSFRQMYLMIRAAFSRSRG